MFNKKLAIGIKTFMRPALLLRNVNLIKENLPNTRIYIADDSKLEDMDEIFYENMEKEGHVIIRLPFDSGISRGRNAIVERVKEPFILMCDDDFEITLDNNALEMVKILEKRFDIGLITGQLKIASIPTGYEYNLQIVDRTIHKLPLESEWEEVDGYKIRQTDLGLNFFVARTEMFKDVKWDTGHLISTEHLDFFLSIKETKWKVYYCPELKSNHNHNVVQSGEEYQKYRNRKFHWKYFANKWRVDWVQEGDERMNYRTEADKWVAQPENINHIVFRDDDICVDTPVKKLKEFTELLEEYGIDEMYSVVPYGKMVKDGEYTGDNLNLDMIIGSEPIENNKALVQFLRKKIKNGHNICLHGYQHLNLADLDLGSILDAKQYLEKVLDCRIFYFAPPFNQISDHLKVALESKDMTVITLEGDALESLVKDGSPIGTYFCWYHWWRFINNPELYEKLKIWLRNHYKKLEDYSK